eukprot:ANDGO_04567.mRNA.1 hypothetical protein
MEATNQYLSQHRIPDLLSLLLQRLLVSRPSNPSGFLIEELRAVQKSGSSSEYFTTADLDAIFDMVDVTHKGTISRVETVRALVNLQIRACYAATNAPHAAGSSMQLQSYLSKEDIEKLVPQSLSTGFSKEQFRKIAHPLLHDQILVANHS